MSGQPIPLPGPEKTAASLSRDRRLRYDSQVDLFARRVSTPIGELLLAASPEGICRVSFPVALYGQWFPWFNRHFSAVPRMRMHPLIREASQQLGEYFAGRRTAFELPLDLRGTVFQQSVWQSLLQIPHGATSSYGEIARQIGSPRASRAVGAAVGQNPLAILVPCHRALGFDGRLVGFAGGLSVKERLLELEGARISFGR